MNKIEKVLLGIVTTVLVFAVVCICILLSVSVYSEVSRIVKDANKSPAVYVNPELEKYDLAVSKKIYILDSVDSNPDFYTFTKIKPIE